MAAALIRLYRSQLPEAQDVADVTPVQERREEVRSYKNTERAAPAIREKHARPVNTTWFSLNVGRHGNADPKWILPLICRLGNVTKAEIGAIRIFDTETKFELAWDSVSGFLASVGASGETEIIFERTTPANQAPPRSGKYGPQRPEGAVTPRAFAKPGARPYVKPTGPKPFNAAKPRRAKG